MSGKEKKQSFISHIRRMSRLMLILLIVPLLISLAVMLNFSTRYHQSIRRMETISSLKPVISEDIPDLAWMLVSGRETQEESKIYDLIDQVNGTLARISQSAEESDSLNVVVALRTMDTLKQYIDQIWNNISNQVPVSQNEAVLNEVRDVAALAERMLNNYIDVEIERSAKMSVVLNKIVIYIVLGEILLTAISLFVSRYSRLRTEEYISEPIQELERVTEKLAHGDMNARIPKTSVHELQKLTGQVNIMADNLEDMMKQRAQDENALRKAELRTLQAQINPHFLYNTLDAIVWKAEAGEESEVIHLTSALSDFFRISLSSGADWIPISQEQKHIAGYLSIQQTRYRDILRYEIDIPDEIGHYYILKLLLQPLVENAIYHGIKFKRGGGIIRVSGRKEGNVLFFSVSDTGKGMNPETLTALRQRMNERQPVYQSGSGGFGMVNVNLRIRLYYNQPEGLHIESGPDGTTVWMRLPCKTKEDFSDD